MDRIADLDLFLRALDQGSISAAARSVNLTPAAGSARLKRLERELGVTLLHRTTRTLTPTPEGEALAARSRVLVEDLKEVTASLSRAATAVEGTLNLTMPAGFGGRFVSPLLPAFLERHPAVALNVDLTDRMVDLVASGYDLALRIGALEDSTLVARRLARNRRVLCASPGYLAKRGVPQTPADLARHDGLLLVGSRDRQEVWHLTDEAGRVVAVRIRGRIRANQGDLLRDAALADLGIVQHSLWHVVDDLDAGRLEIVLPDYTLPESGIYAVMPERRHVPARVRAFVDFLADALGDPPSWERRTVLHEERQ